MTLKLSALKADATVSQVMAIRIDRNRTRMWHAQTKGKTEKLPQHKVKLLTPPDSVLGDDDIRSQSSAEEEDDKNNPHLQADLQTTIREFKEEARRAQSQEPVTFTNPDVGPSKRARPSSISNFNCA
ncbi:hypothetical protein PQX77_015544 [Marasmius sp. AFHP31]|nr:hypothetical protein PQX77_015544 [Marasmius sp. AFHP31]